MAENIDLLTEKIYQEGVARAEAAAADIRARADAEAARLVADAEARAAQTRQRAETEATELRRNTEADLRVAAEQAVSALKQRVRDLLSDKILRHSAREAFADADFLKTLVLEVVRQYRPGADSTLSLPAALRETFDDAFVAQLREHVPGLRVAAGGPSDGFVLREEGEGYQVNFTAETFATFFRPYLNETTDRLLFKDA